MSGQILGEPRDSLIRFLARAADLCLIKRLNLRPRYPIFCSGLQHTASDPAHRSWSIFQSRLMLRAVSYSILRTTTQSRSQFQRIPEDQGAASRLLSSFLLVFVTSIWIETGCLLRSAEGSRSSKLDDNCNRVMTSKRQPGHYCLDASGPDLNQVILRPELD